MELTYTQNGDYLIPNIKLTEQEVKLIGKYGQMRKQYLKEHRPSLESADSDRTAVSAYPEYYKAKSEYRELLTYQANLIGLFGIENVRAEQQKER